MNLSQLKISAVVERLSDLFRAARLSIVEVIFLLAAVGFACFVVFFYFSQVQPLQARIDELETRERAAQAALTGVNERERKLNEQRANAEKILHSLDSFEGYLRNSQGGKAQIIDEIEQLAKKHKIAAGDYDFHTVAAVPLVDDKGNPLQQVLKADKQLKVYPALGIDTQVIGDYPDLRRFLADLERSRQFLIVNAIVFQGEADRLKRAQAQNRGQQLTPGAVPVSLKIELETYFRKLD